MPRASILDYIIRDAYGDKVGEVYEMYTSTVENTAHVGQFLLNAQLSLQKTSGFGYSDGGNSSHCDV